MKIIQLITYIKTNKKIITSSAFKQLKYLYVAGLFGILNRRPNAPPFRKVGQPSTPLVIDCYAFTDLYRWVCFKPLNIIALPCNTL